MPFWRSIAQFDFDKSKNAVFCLVHGKYCKYSGCCLSKVLFILRNSWIAREVDQLDNYFLQSPLASQKLLY